MSVSLIKYDAAKKALAEAHHVDEVKAIRDKAVAMREYARQAKDGELIGWATEIKLRAEERACEMLAEMRENGERRESSDPSNTALPALADLGISRMQSSRWQKLAALPEDELEERIARAKREAIASVELTRADRAAEKKERRAEREAELGAKITALPDKKYGVIYADPPWRFEVWSRETGLGNTSPDNHYPTRDVEGIKEFDVPSIAADDCVLFLWSTVPHLPQALEVMAAWGFAYVSLFGWIKNKAGTGYWVRNSLELLLIGKRGNIPAPAQGCQFDSVIEAPVRAHSQKPDVVYEMIEAMFPTLPKIELFARAARDGFDCWGLEAPLQAEPTS